MKRTFFFLLLVLGLLMMLPGTLAAQTMQQMKNDRARLEKQLAESRQLLATTDKDVKSRLSNLSLLSERIRQQTALVNQLDNELKAVQEEMARVQQEQQVLAVELGKRKESYARALRLSVNRGTFENKMMFLFSSQSFQQMYRRARYLREYSDFQVRMGRDIQARQDELRKKEEELEQLKADKAELLAKQQTEQQALAEQKAEQQQLISRLQKQQANLKSEIKRCQSEYDRLDKKIEQLINEQIAASRKKKSSEGKGGGTGTDKSGKDKSSSTGYKMSAADVKLSGSFASNKGKLPVPVQGSYMIVSHYGINQVGGMKDVKVNNLGVDIRCGSGSSVRSIFDGEVSAVFEHPSRKTYGVLVRHGNYISVYCNLATISVRQGDRLKAGATIGTVHADNSGECILQFQLRKDLQRLNPEEWIRF